MLIQVSVLIFLNFLFTIPSQVFSSILWYRSTSKSWNYAPIKTENPLILKGKWPKHLMFLPLRAVFGEVDRYHKVDENSWNFFSESIFIPRLEENYREPPRMLKSQPFRRTTIFVTLNSRDRVLTCLWERDLITGSYTTYFIMRDAMAYEQHRL